MLVAQHILDEEGIILPYRWPEDTGCTRIALAVEERWCRTCGGALTPCDHRPHRVFTRNGPLQLVGQRAHCPTRACPAQPQTLRPEAETASTMPWGGLGWAVVGWLGQRRLARHGSVGQLRAALAAPYQMPLSADAIATSMHRSQPRLAARRQAPDQLATA
jgi:hypothetical protein